MAQLNELLVTGSSQLLNGLGILGSTNADSILPNSTNTYSLGSSDKKWSNLYVKTSNIDTETVSILTVTNYATIGANQAATGTGTGALRVLGGISGTQNSWFGKSIIMTPSSGVGIKIGTATITAASTTSGEIVLQNGHLRFGGSDWDYNVWAGLKYDPTNKTIYLGLADGTVFTANTAQSGGTLALPGVRYLSINGKIALDGNDSWLRINESKTFSSGTYFGQSIVRTDNQFQVGDSGNKFYANSSGNGYFSNTLGVGGTNTNYKIYTNGKTKVGDGANATSASTGGLQVAGGIGVSGNSWFGGTVTATKFIGPLQGNADSATNIQGWAPKHFYNEFVGGKWYHINMNNTSSDKTGFYKVADIVLTSGYGTYTAAKIIGYLYDHNGNWEQAETHIMPFQAIINITDDVAYLYSNVLANSEHLRIVKTAVRTYELQARCNSTHTDFDVFYQVIGTAGVTPYETLVTGSTTGTVIDITQTQSWGNTAYKASILTNARTLTIGKTGKTFNGSANVSWTLAEIGAVAKAGDTMTGFLTLHANPTANLHAATKQYVDKACEDAAKLYVFTKTISANGTASVTFDNSSAININTCLVYYNGLLLTLGENYTITNNNTIALTDWTANAGDIFTISGKQANEISVTQAASLNVGTVGSTTQPVYFNNGIPVACTSIEDKKVTQSATTASNYRPVVLGATNTSTVDDLAATKNDQVYVSTKFYAQPSTGTFVATKFKGALEGNASTATKLATARTITLDGDVKGSASFDGSGNITITTEAGASGISYVDGSGSTIAGTWIGTNTEISGLYTGLTIAYKIGVAGASTTTLNLTTAAGASGAKTVKRNAGNLTTHLPVGTVVLLTYDGTNWCWADYSTSDTKNSTGTTNSTSILYLAGATSQAANPQTYSNSAIKANCNSSGTNEAGSLTATKVYGAVWNDYAEYRDQNESIEPGYCVASADNGKVYKTTEKFQACDGIVSDTYGFSIGETKNCKTPLAVAGRVLAYCEGDRNNYHAGDTVCAGPNGKVIKMTREEIKEYPDRIIGHVSEIPEYEIWGSGNVKINGRIWIKIK